MTIKRLLQISTIGTCLSLVVILAVSLTALSSFKLQIEKLINTDGVRTQGLADMYAQALQMGQSTRNNLLIGNDSTAQANFEKAKGRFNKALETALQVSAGKEVEELKQIGLLAEADYTLLKKVSSLVNEGKKEEAAFFLVDNEVSKWRELRDTIVTAIEAQKKKAATSLAASNAKAFWGRVFITMIMAIVMCVTVGLGVITYRRIGRRLTALKRDFDIMAQGNLHVSIKDSYNDEISAVAASANAMVSSLNSAVEVILSNAGVLSMVGKELKNGSEKAARQTRDQSLRATQIAAAAEEMSQTIADIARNTSSAKETTDCAVSAAQEGKRTAEDTVLGVKGIAHATDELSDMISEMNSKTAEIGNIVTVINDIADQTNLLALNAAIEAARAGDSGRGFAVVADEVRKLAERTISATTQISSMIDSVRAESVKTSESMTSASTRVKETLGSIEILGSSLESVMANIETAQGQIIQIATAVDEQSATADEIARNVTETSKIAEELRLMSGEVMVGARSLAVLADDLNVSTERFDKKDSLLIFDVAKIRHRLFVEKINGHVEGLTMLQSAELPDHHDCAFGKWYYSGGISRCGHLTHFRDLESPHKTLHKLAKDAVDAYNNRDEERALTVYRELESLSGKLVQSIDLAKKEFAEDTEPKGALSP